MPVPLKLISAIRKFPILYEKSLFHEYQMHADIWEKIASKCGIQSGHEANKLWKDLIQDYIEFLRDGKEFEFGNEMLFVQSHLISIQSDSDELDEDELQRILDSDSETSIPNPTVHTEQIASTSQEMKPYRKRLRPMKFSIDVSQALANADSSTVIDSSSACSPNVSDLSSLQLIFLGYAKVLQDLPLPIQIRTKHKITQIINEAEMSLFELNDGSNDGHK